MDEKMKQRIIGGAVLVALAAIFIPFMLHDKQPGMKVSKAEFQVPPPPAQPEVAQLTQPSNPTTASTDQKASDATLASAPSTETNTNQTSTSTDSQSVELTPPAQATGASADSQMPSFETEGGAPEASAAGTTNPAGASQAQTTTAAGTASPSASLSTEAAAQTAMNEASAPTPANTQNSAAATPSAKATEANTQKAAASKPAKAQAKSNKAKVSSAGNQKGWVIQLGTFSQANNAKTLQKKLSAKGYPVFAETSKTAKGTTVTRLYVGPKNSRDEAMKMQNQLQKVAKVKGVVVSYSGKSSTKG
ncbi:MAG: SPOR domain-containing protein [Proteobacteria bacterium]|nr:SPOR domain-containing protein [Pseudomonadota bacterium]